MVILSQIYRGLIILVSPCIYNDKTCYYFLTDFLNHNFYKGWCMHLIIMLANWFTIYYKLNFPTH